MKLRTITSRLISGKSQLLRQISTATSRTPAVRQSENRPFISKQILYSRLCSAGASGWKVSAILHDIIRKGNKIGKFDLLDCLKQLRKFGRYDDCLQILEWMDKGKVDFSAEDYVLHLSILCKAKGVDEVEKYFDSIPSNIKNQYAYGVLLNFYCINTMTDKALALFKKMVELNYASNVLNFNNLLGLLVKVGKPERVPTLVEEMKRRNIPLNNSTYYFRLQSCRLLRDFEGLEQVMLEVQEQDSLKKDWQMYSNVAAAYTDVREFEKADAALNKMEELLDNSKIVDCKPYYFLITMYANTGNRQSVYHAWDKLKLRYKGYENRSLIVMLQALSNLDDIEGLKNCLKEWELSRRNYDERIPSVTIAAYLKHDMLEEAQLLLKESEDETGQKLKSARVTFMNYHLEKRDFDSALKHLEVAMAANWKPFPEKLDPFFELFKQEKDVDSAEELVRKLQKVQSLDLRTYLWLIQTYAAAGFTASEICQRMELLEKKVC